MKYIIAESQLDRLKSKLNDLMLSDLNSLLDNNRTSDSDFIVIYYNDIPRYEDDIVMEYGFGDGKLYIEKDFLNRFSSMYPLNKEKSAEFISNWFSKEFDVDVKDSYYSL